MADNRRMIAFRGVAMVPEKIGTRSLLAHMSAV